MQVQPYLFFEGRCEEAVAFYQRAIGAELITMMRYRDNPEPQAGNGCMQAPRRRQGDAYGHAYQRHHGDGLGWPLRGQARVQGFALSLNTPDEAAAQTVRCARRRRPC